MQDFNEQGCKMMMDWLKIYNELDIIPFVKAVDKNSQAILSR